MNKKEIVTYILFGIFLFSFSRFIKIFLILRVPQEGIFYFNNLVGLKPYYNPNLSFGIPFSNNLLVVINALIIIFLIDFFWCFLVKRQRARVISIILILTGAFSNLIERIKFGYVIDFFHFWILPIFNLADLLIISGVVLLIIAWHKE
jgi:signal peptidase II